MCVYICIRLGNDVVVWIHIFIWVYNFGRLAQLVQSTSFTPRGSGVRVSHRPQKAAFLAAFFLPVIHSHYSRLSLLVIFLY